MPLSWQLFYAFHLFCDLMQVLHVLSRIHEMTFQAGDSRDNLVWMFPQQSEVGADLKSGCIALPLPVL